MEQVVLVKPSLNETVAVLIVVGLDVVDLGRQCADRVQVVRVVEHERQLVRRQIFLEERDIGVAGISFDLFAVGEQDEIVRILMEVHRLDVLKVMDREYRLGLLGKLRSVCRVQRRCGFAERKSVVVHKLGPRDRHALGKEVRPRFADRVGVDIDAVVLTRDGMGNVDGNVLRPVIEHIERVLGLEIPAVNPVPDHRKPVAVVRPRQRDDPAGGIGHIQPALRYRVKVQRIRDRNPELRTDADVAPPVDAALVRHDRNDRREVLKERCVRVDHSISVVSVVCGADDQRDSARADPVCARRFEHTPVSADAADIEQGLEVAFRQCLIVRARLAVDLPCIIELEIELDLETVAEIERRTLRIIVLIGAVVFGLTGKVPAIVARCLQAAVAVPVVGLRTACRGIRIDAEMPCVRPSADGKGDRRTQVAVRDFERVCLAHAGTHPAEAHQKLIVVIAGLILIDPIALRRSAVVGVDRGHKIAAAEASGLIPGAVDAGIASGFAGFPFDLKINAVRSAVRFNVPLNLFFCGPYAIYIIVTKRCVAEKVVPFTPVIAVAELIGAEFIMSEERLRAGRLRYIKLRALCLRHGHSDLAGDLRLVFDADHRLSAEADAAGDVRTVCAGKHGRKVELRPFVVRRRASRRTTSWSLRPPPP